jgi:TolB-like protein
LVYAALFGILLVHCAATKERVVEKQPETLESQIDKLVEQITTSLAQNQKSKIAVIEFSDLRGNISEFGQYLAEELITRLYLTNKFDVIERQLLQKVIAEHKLNLSGMVDENSAIELGKLLGVEAIASGTITDLGSYVKVNARLISTTTGKIFSAASVKIFKDEVVTKLMSQSIAVQKSNEISSQESTFKTMTANKQGFEIKLTNCEMSNRTIICHLNVTNTTENDKDFHITYGWQYKTAIYDDQGNEYDIAAVEFGSEYHEIKGISQYDGAQKKVIAGLTIPVKLYFENVSANASKVALLQLLCEYRGFKVEFRDITIRKFDNEY